MWLCMSITFEGPCIGQNIRIPLWHCCDIAVTVTYDCCNSTCNACNAHATKLTISLIYDATRNVVRREPALQYPSLILGCIGHIWHIQDWRLKMAGLSPCDQMDLLPDSGMLLAVACPFCRKRFVLTFVFNTKCMPKSMLEVTALDGTWSDYTGWSHWDWDLAKMFDIALHCCQGDVQETLDICHNGILRPPVV